LALLAGTLAAPSSHAQTASAIPAEWASVPVAAVPAWPVDSHGTAVDAAGTFLIAATEPDRLRTAAPPAGISVRAIAPRLLKRSTARASAAGTVGMGLLDVDASGSPTEYDALTDGLLIIRYLFGMTGPALTTGALGPTATRTDPDAIKAYLDSVRSGLDVDGNGTADALTDGLLVIRYLFGLRGDALLAGALDPLATRTTPAVVEAYVQTLQDNPPLITRDVTVALPLLEEHGIPPAQLTVTTLFSEHALVEGETTAAAAVADADKGQILFVANADGTPLLVAYLTASDVGAGSASVTTDSVARGLIMMNPLLLGFKEADRLAILAYAETDPLYDALKTEIDNALAANARDLLDEGAFPKIFEYAVTLVIHAIQGASPDAGLRTFGARTPLAPLPTVGVESSPYLSDVPGDAILAVDPTMLFYGIDIAGFAPQVIAGKESLWELGIWPPRAGITEPVTESIILGSGTFDVRFVKYGLDSTAAIMASGANYLRVACNVLDLLAWCPASNAFIETVVEASPALEVLVQALLDVMEDALDPKDLLVDVAETLLEKENWVAITKFLYSNATDKQGAVQFLKISKTVLKKLAKALEIYEAANVHIPLAWDMLTKPDEVNFCVTQANGVLTSACQRISPTAVIVKLSPATVRVGDVVSFDASQSSDDSTSVGALLVRWDLDGDGIFDTAWSAAKQTSWTYGGVGPYTVRLQVKDADGLVGQSVYTVIVGAPLVFTALPFNTSTWQGNYWCYNNNYGAWFPAVSGDQTTATFIDPLLDYCWNDFRTIAFAEPQQVYVFEVNPLLGSGGIHVDTAQFGFGPKWVSCCALDVAYDGWFSGISLHGGKIWTARYLGYPNGNAEEQIGTYQPGQWLSVRLAVVTGGVQVTIGDTDRFVPWFGQNDQTPKRFLAIEVASADGFQLRNVASSAAAP